VTAKIKVKNLTFANYEELQSYLTGKSLGYRWICLNCLLDINLRQSEDQAQGRQRCDICRDYDYPLYGYPGEFVNGYLKKLGENAAARKAAEETAPVASIKATTEGTRIVALAGSRRPCLCTTGCSGSMSAILRYYPNNITVLWWFCNTCKAMKGFGEAKAKRLSQDVIDAADRYEKLLLGIDETTAANAAIDASNESVSADIASMSEHIKDIISSAD
jgi:hypothetical protein